jgi:uncharacterized membrane protein YeaQ/YmgE (transglycosylase-associated protein family)
MELITTLVIGLVAGIVSTRFLKGPSHGLAVDTVVAAFGAHTAATIAGLLALPLTGFVPGLVVAFAGALALPVILTYIPVKK